MVTEETAVLTPVVTRRLEFCDAIEFINGWGQRGRARVMWHQGKTVSIDYLGCQHEILVTVVTAVL